MDTVIAGLPVWAWLLAFALGAVAGFVKGAMGFALPLILIATLPGFMPARTALAALIFPVLATNLHQALRQGWRPALHSARRFWRIIVMTAIGIVISAPFVVILPQRAMFGLLGVAVLAFALLQLSGWLPDIPERWRHRAEFALGLVGGLYGGISGVWGPPSIVYLLAIRAEKREMVRVMSVVFAIGAVVLTAAHLRSGVLNAQTIPISMAMLLPVGFGMWLGYKAHDRLEPERFRRLVLILLALTALNLLRRALMG